MSLIRDDLRCAFRTMTRRPGLTAAAILTLALGISANTVIFSVVETVLVHPVPFRDADRIAYPHLVNPPWGLALRMDPIAEMTRLWLDGSPSVEAVEAYSPRKVRAGDDETEVWSERVDESMFEFLGVEPALGRGFTDREADLESPVALLSYAFWHRRFGGDPGVLGSQVEVDGVPHTVIGVLPAKLRYLEPGRRAALWLPLDPMRQRERAERLKAIVRLAPGAEPLRAAEELDLLAHEYLGGGYRTVLVAPSGLFGRLPEMLLLLQTAVGCVLLIACVNVAQLLLAQGEGRAREMAMRSVLGAGRRRLVRQLLTESVTLALAGGVAAFVLSLWGLEALASYLPADLRHLDNLEMNAWVLAFTAAVSLASGLVFGLVPALRASAANLDAALRRGSSHGPGPRRKLLGQGLMALQVTLCLALLSGAGALVNTFVRWQGVDFGFETRDLYVLSFSAGYETYEEPARRLALADEILRQVSRASVSDVALAEAAPPNLPNLYYSLPEAEGGRADEKSVMLPSISITPNFFEKLGIRFAAGRNFNGLDREGTEKVAVVNQALVRRYWGEADPIGRRFRLGKSEPWQRVVGVVENVRLYGLDLDLDEPILYRSFAQFPTTIFDVTFRATGAPSPIVRDLRTRLSSLPPNVELRSADSFAGRLRPQLEAGRFHAALATIFAALAVVLSAVGIYGVIAHSVVRRHREIGIRMAMGAEGVELVRYMVLRGGLPIAGGVVFGLAASAGLGRLLNAALHEAIRTWDPGLVLTVAGMVTAVALAAVWLPSQRAAAVEPSAILRHE